MADYRYDNVRLVLGEPNRNLRQGLKSALWAQGFRNLLDTGSIEPVREAVLQNTADLVVCDAALGDDEVWDIIHRVRHHRLGNNPFLLIILLISDPTVATVRRMIDCGPDDIIIKPVASDQLLQRINNLVRGRKPFVVTHDYIGPDRRQKPREGEQPRIPLVDVPNPLRAKVLGSSTDLQRMIDTTAARLNEQKMERYAVQIAYLVDLLQKSVQEEAPDIETRIAHVERLQYVAEDLSHRLRGTQYAHVGELSLSLVSLAERLRAAIETPHHVDLQLLPKLSQAIGRAFLPDNRTQEAAHQISTVVSQHAKR